MRIVLILVVLAALGGVIWYVMDTSSEMPAQETMDTDIVTNDGDEVSESDTEPETSDTETADTASDGEGPTTREFTIDSFMYGYSPDSIRVNEGDTVVITLTNSEGLHDWVVDEFDAATEIISAGEETTITFVADAAGEYEFYCSVGNHRAQGMVGTLIVE